MDDYQYSPNGTVAEAAAADRVSFIRRTYVHLALAILAFAGLEAYLLNAPWALDLARLMGRNWLIVMITFMAVAWAADKLARSSASQGIQYLGLAGYVVIEALIFLPLLLVAREQSGYALIQSAGWMTALLVGGITATAFLTDKDYSFLRGALTIGFFAALAVGLGATVFNAELGAWFSVAMIVLAGGSILYTTSNIIHHYRTDQHVAASLALFAGVMLLFWYILRLLMSRR